MSALWYRGAHRLPADIALSIIPSLPRAHLETLVQKLVDHLDVEDGDPDLENANDAEDDFLSPERMAYFADGPGCEISDAFGVGDEDGCNLPSFYELERRYGTNAQAGEFSIEAPSLATKKGAEAKRRGRERLGLRPEEGRA